MDALYTKRLEEIDSLKIQNCITKGSGLIEKLQKASIENDEDFLISCTKESVLVPLAE